MAEEAAAIEARESAYKLYAEERQARLKQERITMARKIAPGFLDNDDRRILTPTLATAQVKEETNPSAQAITSKYAGNRFDYSEFEARDPADEGPSNRGKNDGSTDNGQSSPQREGQREEIVSLTQDGAERESIDGSEEEVIVQAVPLSELTGMLRDSCLEEESSSSAPRTWHERDPALEVIISTFEAAILTNTARRGNVVTNPGQIGDFLHHEQIEIDNAFVQCDQTGL